MLRAAPNGPPSGGRLLAMLWAAGRSRPPSWIGTDTEARRLLGLALRSRTGRPQPLLARAHGRIDARASTVQRVARALADRPQTFGRALPQIGDTAGDVVPDVVAPVVARQAAGDGGNK